MGFEVGDPVAWLMAANLAVEQVVDLAVDLAVSLVVVEVVRPTAQITELQHRSAGTRLSK